MFRFRFRLGLCLGLGLSLSLGLGFVFGLALGLSLGLGLGSYSYFFLKALRAEEATIAILLQRALHSLPSVKKSAERRNERLLVLRGLCHHNDFRPLVRPRAGLSCGVHRRDEVLGLRVREVYFSKAALQATTLRNLQVLDETRDKPAAPVHEGDQSIPSLKDAVRALVGGPLRVVLATGLWIELASEPTTLLRSSTGLAGLGAAACV